MTREPSTVVLLVCLALAGCAPDEPGARAAPSPSASPSSSSSAVPVVSGCPPSYDAGAGDPWVPAEPTTETAGRLVPDADPVEALVCRYDQPSGGTASLVGARELTAGLDRVRTDLRVPERAAGQGPCARTAGRGAPHLLRLRYADGELWLSAVQEPGPCTAGGNGAFVTTAPLGERLARAYDTGTWPDGPVATASPG